MSKYFLVVSQDYKSAGLIYVDRDSVNTIDEVRKIVSNLKYIGSTWFMAFPEVPFYTPAEELDIYALDDNKIIIKDLPFVKHLQCVDADIELIDLPNLEVLYMNNSCVNHMNAPKLNLISNPKCKGMPSIPRSVRSIQTLEDLWIKKHPLALNGPTPLGVGGGRLCKYCC